MLLSDLADYVINENGQLVIGPLANLGITIQQFWSVVRQELFDYQRFMPLTKKFNIEMFNGSQYMYDFTKDVNNVGYIDPQRPGTVPRRITRMVPTGQQQTLANWLSYRTAGGVMGGVASPSRVPTPRMFLPRYRAPYLYCTEYGQFDIEAQYSYLINEITTPQTPVTATFDFLSGGVSSTVIALPNLPAANKSVVVQFNGVTVATDNGNGLLEFTPEYKQWYQGSVSYSTGAVIITAVDLGANQSQPISVSYANMTDVDLVGIDIDSKVFLDLVSGKFLRMCGLMRRAFVQTDLTITTDAVQLVEEGQRQYDEARKQMVDRCQFYKAIRP